jgi:phosphoglycerate dehydrogenase-like enzyme
VSSQITVTICVPLSLDPTAEIERAAQFGGREVALRYEPSLLPPQQFPADHRGAPDFVRAEPEERRWRRMLADTDAALGFPGDGPAGLRQLAELAPRLRWVQGTAAGAGEQVAVAGLPSDVLARLCVTSAAGLHAVPLAEFALFGLLAFAKDADVLGEASHAREWRSRWPMRLLRDSHVVVLGLGGIGAEVARLCTAFGAKVTGVRRSLSGRVPDGVDAVVRLADLDELLPRADAVVVTLPGTAETRGLLGAARLALLPPHAVVVNVGRGSVIDSAALAAALDAGALRGALLDVADEEPLPATSPLWARPNVVISPHTAALTVDEDDRIVALFADNLQRMMSGQPMRNVVDTTAGY